MFKYGNEIRDIKSAFILFLVRLYNDFLLLGIKFEENYLLDKMLPTGLYSLFLFFKKNPNPFAFASFL